MAADVGVRLLCALMCAILALLWASAMTTATLLGGRNILAQREFGAK